MASDLPQFKTDAPASGRRSARPNKRVLVVLAIAGIFFLLYLNARIDTTSSSSLTPADDISSSSTTTTTTTHSDKATSEETGQGDLVFPDDMSEDDGEDIADLVPDEPEEQQQEELTTTPSTHSVEHHKTVPDFLSEEKSEEIVINDTNHYAYLVLIASSAEQSSRRALIRDKYFGLRNNLLPCMRYNADMLYKFLIYGGPSKAGTAERRRYEAEKMEWNDLEEMPAKTSFEQATVLEWAETTLAEQGITYDYLVVQDINTFVQLSVVKQELDNGVLSESTDSPVTVNPEAPTNIVWGTFGGDERDKHAFIIGSAAAKLALEKRSEIDAASNSDHLLSNMYAYYQSVANTVEHEVDAAMEPEAAAEVQEQVIPVFIREDGPDDNQRFIRWENNVESVHIEDSVVTHVYQDSEFAELVAWTSLKPSTVCYPRKSAFKGTQPTLDALDDDEDLLADDDDSTPPTEKNSTTAATEDKPSIALMTSSFIYDDNCMEPSATMAAMNKRKFALRHGHSFVARSAEFAQQRGRKTVWGKVDAVEKVLPKYDWIFWMDMDAVIMNQEHSLFELLDELRTRYPGGAEAFDTNVDLIAAKPRGDPMLNAGVFFLRNSPWSMQFLRDVQGVTEWYNKGSSYEQGAMWQVMGLEQNAPHIFLLDGDDHTFNTFPKRYQPGDFIVHFAPDKCPNALTLQGLAAADRIEQGEAITHLDLI
ncbi:hypothetical protein K492DRAFT_228361 [Lichtheimia hyalospora FSU 10163]|nr:hypothetical protein K492DRAFT_228361 [Lichtheimia hyalospora FSU 10163]